MTKEQFIVLKNDMKNAIEEEKYCAKRIRIESKMYYNGGFDSEEAQKNKENEILEQERFFRNKITEKKIEFVSYFNELVQRNWRIYASLYTTHWAYYCAKHQLNEEERKEYYTKQFNSMKPNKRYATTLDRKIKEAEKIIFVYENLEKEIIRFD